MSQRRVARVHLAGELLHQLLYLPEGVRVTGCRPSLDRIDDWELLLEGDALPDKCVASPGGLIEEVRPYYQRTLHRTVPWERTDVTDTVETTSFDGFR